MYKYDKSHPESIQAMFGSIARDYDKANAVLSFQMHKSWNRTLVRHATQGVAPGIILDLCSGTGDIAFEYLLRQKNPQKAVLLDFCEEMLACAKDKAIKLGLDKHSIEFIQADAQKLPFPSESIPCVTMAYGIRNIQDPLKSMREVYRVLKPGGTFAILELTQPKNKLVNLGHTFYLRTVLPVLGKWLTSNEDAYQYLCSSIKQFIPPDRLEQLLKEAGFQRTSQTSLTLGTATVFVGYKDVSISAADKAGRQ